MPRSLRGVVSVLCLTLLVPAAASAASVRGLFPSDTFTVFDFTQNTLRRVNLPKPNCAQRPSDCADIDVINTLDGFNLQPRLSIVFDGPIDVSTVSSQTVFLLSLGSTLPEGPFPLHVVGINQVVWDPETLTLHAESDELLDQHTRYALIVTAGVHDLAGEPLKATTSKREDVADVVRAVREAGFGFQPIAGPRRVAGCTIAAITNTVATDSSTIPPW